MCDLTHFRRLVIATVTVYAVALPAAARGQSRAASDYVITHFTTDNGLSGGVIDEIVQTPDGFLWIVTNGSQLVRFDGSNFHRFATPRARELAITTDGGLWAGTQEAVLRIPPARLNQFTLDTEAGLYPTGRPDVVNCLRVSRSGVLWVGTTSGLFRREGDRFVPVGPPLPTHEIEEAPDGHILATNGNGYLEFAGSTAVPHPGLAARLGVRDNQIFHVMRDRDGTTWYSTAHGVAREKGDRIERLGTYASTGHTAYRTLEDTEGTVWIVKEEGLFRAVQGKLELVASGLVARTLYSDRDGDLWVGTNGDGLYRFKRRAVRMFTTADGLPSNIAMTVILARNGMLWSGANCGGLSRFDGARFVTFSEKDGLLNSCVWALAEDAGGDLWIATWGGGAFRYHEGRFTQFSKQHGLSDDVVTSVVAARDGSIWFGTHAGVTRLSHGRLRAFTMADGLASELIVQIFEDRAGIIWIGTRAGLYRFAADRFERVASVPSTRVFPAGQDRQGRLVVGTDTATLRLDNGRAETFPELTATTELFVAAGGELWLAGDGIARLPPEALVSGRSRDEPLDYERFSIADGLSTSESSGTGGRVLAYTTDDKLWVATPKGLAQFDLRRMPLATAKPRIYLTDVTIGRNRQQAGSEVVLPAGSSHLEIKFAAVDISSPEKIRLQYRLDGVDSEWLDAGASPRAIYSNIPVGTHALHIRACNRSGIWDREGVVFKVTQQPYFYQTRWFAAAVGAVGLLFVSLVHRMRMRQMSRAISVRFDERLAERTRVARELHDTFLQTVQGSKLVADLALKTPDDNARMVRAMEQLSAWLGRAAEEGRAALNSLRGSTTERNNLADALRRAVVECRGENDAEISVTGESREIHPVVGDEIYRIAYEAIRNACAHSGAEHLEVSLTYARDLTLRVSDRGGGIDPAVLEHGRDSHFGLRGMRERAERINAELTFVSSPGAGTVVTLVVPGRAAFVRSDQHR